MRKGDDCLDWLSKQHDSVIASGCEYALFDEIPLGVSSSLQNRKSKIQQRFEPRVINRSGEALIRFLHILKLVALILKSDIMPYPIEERANRLLDRTISVGS